MRSSARVVVIGGGVIGCSILYHLTRLGWSDVMLVERDELTSGSTWHAAGGIHGLHDSNNISRLQYYTLKLYAELEKETGQSCGIHQPGSIYLACSAEREYQLRLQHAKARHFGVEFNELSLPEVRELHPLLVLDDVRCAMFEPDAGYIDPAGVPQAYAAGARARGAEIVRFNPVLETNPRPDGSWDVVTRNGTVHAEHVVNAAGLWGREVARMAGIEVPLMTMEHQYFVTETIAEIAALPRELPSVSDRDKEYYLRQEGMGLLVGAYERDGRFWAVDGMPEGFGHELLPNDLDRIEDYVMAACARLPLLAEAGIKTVINGPMIWSPDASALLGPVPELRNYHMAGGVIPGFSQSGGLGLALAQWIVDGEPEMDLWGWDMARFGDWASKPFTMARAMDNYSSRFRIHFPNEAREGGRPLRTRAVYERQKNELGAVFGFSYGWEHPMFYAAGGCPQRDHFSFERAHWFETMGEEARTLREGVGVIDISNFAKYRIRGPGAAAWLDYLLANRLPAVGRVTLSPMIGVRGGVAGDFTLSRLDDDDFFMIGSGIAERYHARFINPLLPAAGVEFESLSESHAGFNIAGPRARDLLARLTNADVGNEAFRFLRARRLVVAGIDAIVVRVSFTGDLGYEIWVEERHQAALYEAILGQTDLAPRPVGSRALGSLRIEKGYGSWGREYSPEYWPHESGLARLVKTDKGEFMNRAAWLGVAKREPREVLCCMAVDGDGVDPAGGEPVFAAGGEPVGRISSASYGFTVGRSVALGYLRAEHARPGGGFTVPLLGRMKPLEVLAEPLFDPRGERLRG